MNGFFDTIEKNPLTPEQRLAVVTDEEATLVLAGAGSCKTSSPTPFRAPINCQAIYNPTRGLCLSAAGPALLALRHEFDRTGDLSVVLPSDTGDLVCKRHCPADSHSLNATLP